MPPTQPQPQPSTPNKKKSPLLWIVLLVLVAGVAAYFLMGDSLSMGGTGGETDEAMEELENIPPPPPTPSSPDNSAAGSVPEGAVTVTISDTGVEPKEVTISAGQSVTFVNTSSKEVWPASAMHPTHMVYDGTNLEAHCAAGATPSFDSCGGLPTGEAYTFTFDKAGTWGWHDHLNVQNNGRIIVQ